MTERGRASLLRSQASMAIGPSSLHWDGAALHMEIDEWTAPLPSRVRGKVTLRPEALSDQAYALEPAGRHHWKPIAPRARVEVYFDQGALAWRGDGYLDCNWGDEPLQRGFRHWHWSRAHARDCTHVFYDLAPRLGDDRSLALKFDRSGAVSRIEPAARASLPATFWGMPRQARQLNAATPRLIRTLEDTPFYARSLLAGDSNGTPADIMHESLSLDRFRRPIVQAMLPFRMPRLVGRR